MASRNPSHDYISDINVTPLVDVMLVLLVVMMVTASYAVSRSLNVNLPQASTGSESERSLMVALAADGTVTVNQVPKTLAELRALAERLQAQPGVPRATIAADGSVPHRRVVEVMDVLRQEHVEQLAIAISHESSPSGVATVQPTWPTE